MGLRKHGRERRTEHLSDHGLVALIARGDREAFARLYDRYCDAAYSVALRVVRDRELAADIVQNAFLTVWQQAEKYDPQRGQPSHWILTVTHHKAVDVVRREQRRRADPLDERHDATDESAAVEQQAWLSVTREQIRHAPSRLPDPHREVIELAYFAGYTLAELAERLALPLGTIKSRTFAAMAALRRSLSEAGVTPEGEWNTSTS